MNRIICNIVNYADKRAIGEWRRQSGAVGFHIKDSDVVVTTEAMEFITVIS